MLFNRIRFDPSMPFVARAAGRSIVGTLNFAIVNLAAQELRNRRFGQTAVEGGEHADGDAPSNEPTLDARNEIDQNEVQGDKVEQQLRDDQGFEVGVEPLVLASQLKFIRDVIADDLDANAGLRRNPLNGKLMKNPFDLAQPISESFARQLALAPRVDMSMITKVAKVVGLTPEDVIRVVEQRHKSANKFLSDNAAELFSIIDNLGTPIGDDGHPFEPADDESVLDRLPALNQARLIVAADRGLWYERERQVQGYMRGNPNALGNIGIIDGVRKQLHNDYAIFMAKPHMRTEIEEAVNRGAAWPVLIKLVKVDEKAAAA